MVGVPLVLWAFSHPSDLDIDAFGPACPSFVASKEIQGSNRITAMRIIAYWGVTSVLLTLASTEFVAFVGSDSFGSEKKRVALLKINY